MRGFLVYPLAGLLTVSAFAEQKNFVSCPIVRDTPTVPCFLAEYQGETYFLGIQQDIGAEFYPPQLLHDVLVEGTVEPGPRVCGGIPLEPLKISVVQELNRACNTILPAEPGIDAPPARRPAGPSTRTAPFSTPPPTSEHPEPPFEAKDFTILYDFDSDFLFARDTRQLTEIAEYVRVSRAPKVEVTGYRASSMLSSGTTLVENARVANLRMKRVVEVLRGLGVPSSAITENAKDQAQAANGTSDPQNRKVVVRIVP